MQTLGISESTPRSENWFKSLFWPSITSGADVDYLGTQGYWVCTIVAVMSLAFLLITGQPILGFLVFLFYYFGGMGVRERSIYAAILVFLMYLLDTILGSVSVLRILFCALLLSNVRATYIAYVWTPGSAEAELPPRLGATLADKFADRLPLWLWPKIRIVYYVYSAALILLIGAGWAAILAHRAGGLAR